VYCVEGWQPTPWIVTLKPVSSQLLWLLWDSLAEGRIGGGSGGDAKLCAADADCLALLAKAAAELLDCGQRAESANRQLQQLWDVLEALL
jgi:hypothetical protein